MPRSAPRFTQTELTRAVRGVKAAGETPRTIHIDRSGNIVIQIGAGTQTTADNPWDEVLEGKDNAAHQRP